jgi:hypothetical protein
MAIGPRHRRSALLCLGVLAAASWPACSKSASNGTGATTTAVATSSRTTTGNDNAPSVVRELVRLPPQEATWVDISGDRLTWTLPSTPEGRHDQVVVYDLTTRQQQVVARAPKPNGVTDWSRISGNLLAFTEQDREASTGEGSPWRIVVLDLESGKRRIVDHDRSSAEQQFVPTVEIDYPWVAWARPSGQPQRYDLLVLNLDSGQQRTIVKGEDLFNIGLSSSAVTYTLPPRAGEANLFVNDLATTAPARQLTTSGRVNFAAGHGDETAVYSESTPDGHGRVMAVPLSGGEPRTLAADLLDSSNPVSSDSIAAWWDRRGAVVIADLRHPNRPTVTESARRGGHIPSRLAVDGNRVVWGERVDDNPLLGEVVVSEVG